MKKKMQMLSEEIEPEIVRGVIKDVSESGVGLYSDFEFQLEDGMFSTFHHLMVCCIAEQRSCVVTSYVPPIINLTFIMDVR